MAGYLLPITMVKGGRRSNVYRLCLSAHQPPIIRPRVDGSTAHQPSVSGREQEQAGNRNRNAAVEALALEKALATPGVRKPAALAAKIRREDRAALEREIDERQRREEVALALAECNVCDDSGLRWSVDGETGYRCDHRFAIPAPDLRPAETDDPFGLGLLGAGGIEFQVVE